MPFSIRLHANRNEKDLAQKNPELIEAQFIRSERMPMFSEGERKQKISQNQFPVQIPL